MTLDVDVKSLWIWWHFSPPDWDVPDDEDSLDADFEVEADEVSRDQTWSCVSLWSVNTATTTIISNGPKTWFPTILIVVEWKQTTTTQYVWR